MTQFADRHLAGDLLTELEDLELPLLTWGLTDGALSEQEVLETIDRAVAARPQTANGRASQDIRDFLQERALLFRVPGSTPPRYRTRLAETLRLTAQLRQLFPPRGMPGPPMDWWHACLQTGRRLPPTYLGSQVPALGRTRWQSPFSVLAQAPAWGRLQTAVTAAQIGSRDLAQFQVDAAMSIYSSLMSRRPGVSSSEPEQVAARPLPSTYPRLRPSPSTPAQRRIVSIRWPSTHDENFSATNSARPSCPPHGSRMP